jgi:hypothetical protein
MPFRPTGAIGTPSSAFASINVIGVVGFGVGEDRGVIVGNGVRVGDGVFVLVDMIVGDGDMVGGGAGVQLLTMMTTAKKKHKN